MSKGIDIDDTSKTCMNPSIVKLTPDVLWQEYHKIADIESSAYGHISITLVLPHDKRDEVEAEEAKLIKWIMRDSKLESVESTTSIDDIYYYTAARKISMRFD